MRRTQPTALQARPRSAVRTQSLAPIAWKREYFEYRWETIGDFGPAAANLGVWRPIANLQKPANGGHFSDYSGWFLQASDLLAGDAVLIAPVSTQIPC